MKFLILTALEEVERQEVKKLLGEVTVDFHPITRTEYYVGKLVFGASDHEVILGRTDQTNVNSGIETERAIAHHKPDYLFFLGVAGGLKDVKIGDIVIGKEVYGYERGKTTVNGFLPRPTFGFSTYELERLATLYSHSEEWRKIRETITHKHFEGKNTNVFTGTIAAGEKVDASVESDLHRFLKTNCSHALAIEMEGLGFLEASRPYPNIKTLLLRGISDLVEGKSAADGTGSQNFATQNAARFTLGLISYILQTKDNAPVHKVNQTNIQADFLELARTLYPEGVKEKSIWERAGGDLSRLSLSGMNGRTQWFEAFKLITNGGGGFLTLKTLIKEMIDDYPSSDRLSALESSMPE